MDRFRTDDLHAVTHVSYQSSTHRKLPSVDSRLFMCTRCEIADPKLPAWTPKGAPQGAPDARLQPASSQYLVRLGRSLPRAHLSGRASVHPIILSRPTRFALSPTRCYPLLVSLRSGSCHLCSLVAYLPLRLRAKLVFDHFGGLLNNTKSA